MTRIVLGLEYDGRQFNGWQSQAAGRTIQDVLERALGAIAAAPVRLIAAGRTDAGVHASLQVAHFDTDASRPLGAWVRGVNTLLPPDVAVRWACEAPAGFHARFAARERAYTYVLLNRPARPGLLAGRVGWFHRSLSVARMREAAEALVGERDFSAFRAAECQATSPVRTLRDVAIARRGELVCFGFRADAFLHHMVRNLVGSLVYVGKGKYPPRWLGEVLASRDRSRAAPTFPPDGLYLTGVVYPPAMTLPESRQATPFAFAPEDGLG
jgi:tRNA pseudouridine38-40 synthase